MIFLLIFLLILPVQADYPQRIVSAMPSITETLFALGLEDRIVGVTGNCNYPPEAAKKEKIGGYFLNLEKVVSLKPDLVVMFESAQPRDMERFRAYGLPVYTVNPRTVIEVVGSLLELGEKTGTRARAQELVAAMKNRLLAIKAKTRRASQPKILVVIGYNPLIVAGSNNFINDLLQYSGAENIAGATKIPYPQYSFERLLETDPEYIVMPAGLVKKEELKNNPHWQRLQAVKSGRILVINPDILSRPGPRLVEAVEAIARFINDKKT